MATIRKRGDKWQALVRRKGHKDFAQTFTKKVLAQRWAKEQEHKIEEGTFRDTREASKTYIKALVEKYKTDILPTRAKSSHIPMTSRLKTIEDHFGSLTLAALSPDHILAFVDDRLSRLGSDAIRKELQLLGDIVSTAQAVWRLHLPSDPVLHAKQILTKLRKLEPQVERTRRLTDDEYKKLMEHEHKRHTNIQAVIKFALATGMRRSEIARAKREHINLPSNILQIPEAKNDWKTGAKGRVIPLFPDALDAIKGLPLYINKTIFNMEPASITRAFNRLCSHCGITDLHFHDLRHEATSRLFEKGYSIQEVASITGHKDWKSLKRYTHPDPVKLAKRS